MELMIYRHGKAMDETKMTLAGWQDVELSDQGKHELIAFKASGSIPLCDAYYSSDLSRCAHSAHILFSPHDINGYTPQFREANYGSFENMRLDQLDENQFLKNWMSGIMPYHYQGETYIQFSFRVMHGLSHALAFWKDCGYKRVGLCTHLGVIRCIMMHLCNGDSLDFLKIYVPFGGGVIMDVDIDGEGFTLNSIRLINIDPSVVSYFPDSIKKYLKA